MNDIKMIMWYIYVFINKSKERNCKNDIRKMFNKIFFCAIVLDISF